MGEATRGGRQWELLLPWPVFLQLSQQSRCPDFFLFLCRLLSPPLKAFAQAATFLHEGQLPDTGEAQPQGRQRAQGRGFACVQPWLLDSSLLQSRATWSSCSSSYRPLPRRKGSSVSPKQPAQALGGREGLLVAAAPYWAMKVHSRKEGYRMQRPLGLALALSSGCSFFKQAGERRLPSHPAL